jgi:hypothetical protein
MAWDRYVLNEFIDDYLDAQNLAKSFITVGFYCF